MKKANVFKDWTCTWRLIWAKGWYVPASAVLDVLFLVFYGFMTAPVFDKLTEHVIVVGTLVTEQVGTVAGRARPAVIDALFQPPVSRYTWQFFALLVLLAVVIFVLFCVFQGLAWFAASRLAGSKMCWRKYLLAFARINLLWAGIYFLWQCADTILKLRGIAVAKMMGQAIPESGIAMPFLLGVVAYFAVISYPLLEIRRAFMVGVRKIAILLPPAVIVVLQFVICNYLLNKLAAINPKLSFIAGAIVLLVLLAWTRAYVTLVVKRNARV